MPFSNPNYNKLKTNLRLAINRLKLLEKKKTETALKARKEISDYMSINKIDRAKIRVEHIIREDYMVEAMEIVEMLCDLLLARFGLIQQMSKMDEGLKESITSLIWVAPQLQGDVPELRIVADMLTLKYGLDFAKAATGNTINCVNEKLVQKMSVHAPPKLLVEQYLVAIGKSHNVAYTPDPLVMKEGEILDSEKQLLDFLSKNDDDENSAGAGGAHSSTTNAAKKTPLVGFNYPSLISPSISNTARPSAPEKDLLNDMPPSYSEFASLSELKNPNSFDYINLPNVPSSTLTTPAKKLSTTKNSCVPTNNNEDSTEINQQQQQRHPHFVSSTPNNVEENIEDPIDFDDLNRRFEELKKKK